jgi:hypothetical protein
VVAAVSGIRALMVTSDQRRRVRRLELLNEDAKTVALVELDEPASADRAVRPGSRCAHCAVMTNRHDGPLAFLVAGGLRAVEHDEDHEPTSVPCGRRHGPREAPASVLLSRALSDFPRDHAQ